MDRGVDGAGHKTWTVDLAIDRRNGQARATARLCWRNQTAIGVGCARLHPADGGVSDIGDELAVARALADLSRQLMVVTIRDIEVVADHLLNTPAGRSATPHVERTH